ncbi:phospho-2-dehydro-3-deoxyheptonate aldolase [Dehalogenimonas lykanthroporepellens BL-DC-9]|nr:phospho-2-dehydro-3-deoxyheptonate aldolase [Dehalogenimonas lykanthroporepellens BL-DC-9]
MIIMKKDATPEQIDHVIEEVSKVGLRTDVSRGQHLTVIGLVGDERQVDFTHLAALPGVKEARMIEAPYKLINREYTSAYGETSTHIVNVGGVAIGGDEPVVIAGPCAVEDRDALFRIAEQARDAGAQILRGGVFKPRSSVHSFQGLGSSGEAGAVEALTWLREAGDRFGMPVVTEVRGEAQAELVARYVDIIQIGSRNMYDQDLLQTAARTGLPIIFKRHFGASVEEFLSFAEYIAAEGNKDIILCERGIVPVGKGKSFTRYLLDLSAVPVIQKETFLPIIVDPSHATGRRDLIRPMSLAAIAAGADGLMIETHDRPEEALCDAAQMIPPGELEEIIAQARQLRRFAVK